MSMAGRKQVLLEKWRRIEEQEERLELAQQSTSSDDDDENNDPRSPSNPRLILLQSSKEQWFSEAYNFLICIQPTTHIWCEYWDIMGPLLETFFNYFKVEDPSSPLRVLWKRVSGEMRKCAQCVSRHHQAQEFYRREYERDFISPLLDIWRCLDEERVGQHLKDLNLTFGGRDRAFDSAEVVSLMFEVLTFPTLLDDEVVDNEFQKFIEAVDDAHELTLAKEQNFPGVYALLFLQNRKSRAIGRRLAGNMGKLRCMADVDPLQPLLKRCIGFLAGEAPQQSSEFARPRVRMERMTVWLGLKALLSFLEPPALEEGILEPYPIFLNFVLDHISDDSPEFSHAVNCMRLLFEILGCKLWLRTSLPPSVMRDSLLSQCFHTRNEKTHKEIFDLFQPLLQSLEPLNDGEFEKQRRHLLYFLLHQVIRSSNFSMLMRKKACQIALLIVHRGYTMNPPSPPIECVHMWGPSLVTSLNDKTLHTSLRQPAIDLVQIIIVSDATALLSSLFHGQAPTVDNCIYNDSVDEIDDSSSCTVVEETNVCCWSEFTSQSNIVSQEYTEWMCAPLLWLNVLADMEPSSLPISISKSVLWAMSRFCMVEPGNFDSSVPVKTWQSSNAGELLGYLSWNEPTGSNDGGDGKPSKNSVRVSTMCNPLIKTFKRLAVEFIIKMEQGDLRRQWTWEPQMSETLILLISEPNHNLRQVGRCILEHVSEMRGLTPGLQFLCRDGSSLAATFSGLKHALKLVQMDFVLANFRELHHFFFALCKIFKEGCTHTSNAKESASLGLNPKFATQGGFLRQPTFDSLHGFDGKEIPVVEQLWESFNCGLADVAWPTVKMCLRKGKKFLDYQSGQMTFVRLLEILPVVFEKLSLSPVKMVGKSSSKMQHVADFDWLCDFIEWGRSTYEVVTRYWKQSLTSLIALLKDLCNDKLLAVITTLEKAVSSDSMQMDSLIEEVSRLSASYSTQRAEVTNLKSNSFPEELMAGRQRSSLDMKSSSCERADNLILTTADKDKRRSLILEEAEHSNVHSGLSPVGTRQRETKSSDISEKRGFPRQNIEKKDSSESRTLKPPTRVSEKQVIPKAGTLASLPQKSDATKHVLSSSLSKVKNRESGERVISSKSLTDKDVSSVDKVVTQSVYPEGGKIKQADSACKQTATESVDKISKTLVPETEDPLDLALKSAGRNHSSLTKQVASVPKRRVVQLSGPVDSRSGYMRKLEAASRRFKPPKLDDWFRPILELDYFAAVGLASGDDDENKIPSDLKEVPVTFESPQQYVDIFRPLVLEEFKAQLRSSFAELSSLEEMSCLSLSVVSVEKIDDFHLVRCVLEENDIAASNSCMENDLVLFTKQPPKNTSHNVHLIGKVERREKDNKRRQTTLIIRFFLQSGYSRLNRARKQLLDRSKWFLSRIMSITPQLREFQALSSIEVIPALPVILRPSNHYIASSERAKVGLGKLPKSMQQAFESTFNKSQIQAIGAVVQSPDCSNGFELSLIQGPPGTGKTRTIVALISALLAVTSRSSVMEKQSSGSLKVNSNPFTNFRARISESAAIARAWQDAGLARQLNNDEQNDRKVPKASINKRVLVCAQSNAAVDELVSRLAGEGICGVDGNSYKPYLVRVGNSKTVHPNSLPFFIDTLVEHRLADETTRAGDKKTELSEETSTVLRENLEKIVDRIKVYESRRANLKDEKTDNNCASDEHPEVDEGKKMSNAELSCRLRTLYQQKKEIYMRLATTQAREKKMNEETKALRNKLRRSILKEAEIVVTTLSGCGGDLYAACFESTSNGKGTNISEQNLFDAVVVDEAAQALEPASLIPLQLLKSSGTKCIMVGDPKQLPATVLSNVASRYLYECSMFERLQRAGHPVIMLTEQYRMHPEISRFPSQHFYDGKLLNGVQSSSKRASFHKTKGLGPYVFYDVTDGQELYGTRSGSSSLYNEGEANAAVEIVKFLQKRYPSEFTGGRIGIITPYKSQLSLLRSRFSSVFGSSVSSEMEFNTVDGFQGREVDILILSTVRSSDISSASPRMNSSSIGFVADVRRMNVALTRARYSLWILGNAKTLQKNVDWAALIMDAKERKLVISVKRPYKTMFEMILGKSSQNSVDTQEMGSEKIEDRQQVMQIKDNHENHKKKRKYSGSKPPGSDMGELDKTVGRDCSWSTKRTEGIVDKQDNFSGKEKSRQDTHKSGKQMKKITDGDLLDSEKGKKKKISGSGSDGLKDSHQLAKSQDNKGGLIMKDNCKIQGKGTIDRGQRCKDNEKPKDLISKRKQQREAVDALLSSALLPSKNSKSSLKSVSQKRNISPPISRGDGLKHNSQQEDAKDGTQGQKKHKSSTSFSLRRS